jgi:hypothetical protein
MDGCKVTGTIIFKDTGEIKTEMYEGDRLVRGSSVDAYRRKLIEQKKKVSDTMEWNLEGFMKMYTKEIQLWMNDLSSTEKVFLFSIGWCISYDDCHLQYANGIDIGSEDLVKITGLSRPVVYQTIASLIKKDILYKGRNSKNRQYFVNPWIFCKGNRISKVLKTMFKNYRIRVLNGVKWKDL